MISGTLVLPIRGGFKMRRPRLLDLFCGAGGCSVGYNRAGFDVVGVDLHPQKNYPYEIIQGDAMLALGCLSRGDSLNGYDLSDFDAIHASPPCQAYTSACFTDDQRSRHQDLLPATRDLLIMSGKPWVIENVMGAPFEYRSVLCGLMFGLKVFRHRGFECSFLLMTPSHPCHKGKLIGVDGMRCPIGHGGWASQRKRNKVAARESGEKDSKESWQVAMGIDWMTRDELAQAIPPAYTQFVGRQLMNVVEGK